MFKNFYFYKSTPSNLLPTTATGLQRSVLLTKPDSDVATMGTFPIIDQWGQKKCTISTNRPVFEANCQKSSPLSIIQVALASFRTAAYHEITAPLWPLPRHHVLQTDVNPTACKYFVI